jgi:hypothetical protein
MGCDVRTIGRAFHDVKQLNVATVQRIRTGRGKSDQYNRYWLNIPRLRELQGEHRTVLSDADNEHTSLLSDAHAPSTGQIEQEHQTNTTRAPDATVREGFEVKQVLNKSSNTTPQSENHKSVFTLRPTRKTQSVHKPFFRVTPLGKTIPELHEQLREANTKLDFTPENANEEQYWKARRIRIRKHIQAIEKENASVSA